MIDAVAVPFSRVGGSQFTLLWSLCHSSPIRSPPDVIFITLDSISAAGVILLLSLG